MWQHYQELQKQCDAEIEKILRKMSSDIEEPKNQGTEKPTKKRNKPVIEDFHLLITKLTFGKDPIWQILKKARE